MTDSIKPEQMSALGEVKAEDLPESLRPMGEIKQVDTGSYAPTPPSPEEKPLVPAKPWWARVRVRKINTRIAEEVIASMEAGTGLEQAAAASGVARTTLQAWIAQGHDEDQLGKNTLLAQFYRATHEAGSRCEDRYVTIIANAAQVTWTAAAWMLERKFPARYGQRVQVTVEMELQKAMDKLRRHLPAKEYEKVLEALASDQYVEEKQLPAGEQTIETEKTE